MPASNQRRIPNKGSGHFFSINRQSFAAACSLGLNAAVVYLVLACGTGRDNRLTAWSVNAIERYTSISRRRAKTALGQLIEAGLVQRLKGGRRPSYELLTRDMGEVGWQVRNLPDEEEQLLRRIEHGQAPSKLDEVTLLRLIDKGLVDEPEAGYYIVRADEETVWLPNAIVTGASGETPPIERMRQGQDVTQLRLMVDLYYVQDLPEDGGISRRILHQTYERVRIGEQAQFVIWGFRRTATVFNPVAFANYLDAVVDYDGPPNDQSPAPDLLARLAHLEGAGALEWMAHLYDSDGVEGEMIHPYGLGQTNSPEDQLGRAAHNAARGLLTGMQFHMAEYHGRRLAPAPRHITNMQMIGIARMRYRAQTKRTSAWYARMNTSSQQYLTMYSGLLQPAA